jgi:methyl-accepting chemotaxis protein
MLGTKIATVVISLVVVTLLLVGYVSYAKASDALLESYSSSLTVQAQQTAQIVSAGIKEIRTDLLDAADDIVKSDGSGIQNILAEHKNTQDYAYIAYTSKDGKTVSADGDAIDFSQDEGFQSALKGQSVFSRALVLEQDNGLYFFVFTPVDQGSNGVVSTLVKYENLYRIIRDIKIGETGYALMTDKHGSTTLHPVTDKVINKENATEAAKNNPQLKKLGEIAQRSANRETGFDQYSYNGVVKFMSFAPVADTDFAIQLAVPKDELFVRINGLLRTIIISSAASLAIILVCLLLFIRSKVSKPLKRTANFAAALASGNLDEKISIGAKDEVGQLSNILDKEVRQAFKEIEENRVISEKQSHYSGEQVDKLVVNLERISKGELTCDMTVSEPDEDTQETFRLFTRISDSLHLTVNTISGYIREISDVLEEWYKAILMYLSRPNIRVIFLLLKNPSMVLWHH